MASRTSRRWKKRLPAREYGDVLLGERRPSASLWPLVRKSTAMLEADPPPSRPARTAAATARASAWSSPWAVQVGAVPAGRCETSSTLPLRRVPRPGEQGIARFTTWGVER